MALYVGKDDDLSTPEMGGWTYSQLIWSKNLHYKELDNWDHSSFSIGKDMTYFDDVLGLIRIYK